MKTQIIGKVVSQGDRLSIYIPKKDRRKFKKGDNVIIVKWEGAMFVPANELVKP